MRPLLLIAVSLCLISCASKKKSSQNSNICESFDHYILLEIDSSIKLSKVEDIPFDCRYKGEFLNKNGKLIGKIRIIPARSISGDKKNVFETFYLYERKRSELMVENALFSGVISNEVTKKENLKIHIKKYPIKGKPNQIETVGLIQSKGLDIFVSLRTNRVKRTDDKKFQSFIANFRIQSK